MPGLNLVSIIDVKGKSDEYLRGLGHLAYTFLYALETDVSKARKTCLVLEIRREEVKKLHDALLSHLVVAEEDLKRNEEQVEIFKNYIRKVGEELERRGKEPLDFPS